MLTGFDVYMNWVGRWPLLTPSQEIELAKLFQAGKALEEQLDGREPTPSEAAILKRAKRAADRMMQCNLRLVIAIARKYAPACKTLQIDDLVQSGAIGLRRAVEKFDHTKGYKFSTYASWWIRQRIYRDMCNCDYTVRVPLDGHAKWNRIRHAYEKLSHDGCRIPERAEILAEAEVTAEDYERLRRVREGVGSLDIQQEDQSALIDLIPDPSTAPQIREYDGLHTALALLPNHDREILIRRYGLDGQEPETMAQLGRELGITREAIRTRICRAERKLGLILRRGVAS